MKYVKIILPIFLLALMSFSEALEKQEKSIAGTYGFNVGQSRLQLEITEDNTFYFIDETRLDKKVYVKGKWIQKGKTIHLTDYNASHKIPKKWKLDKDYPCIKSRIGLKFIRICGG